MYLTQALEIILYPLSFAFGLLFGSFTNVLIYRMPLDQSVVRPRSSCPSCRKLIPWYENIPVISYILLRGQCSGCKTKISSRYPLIELLVGVLFLVCAYHRGPHWLLFARDWPLMVILTAITFIDLDHRIIPDELNLAGLVLGLGTAYWDSSLGGIWMSVAGASIGFIGFFLLGTVYEKLTGKEGLGGGDVKYLTMAGSFVGPMGIFTTILISSVTGSIVGLATGYIQKQRRSQLQETTADGGPPQELAHEPQAPGIEPQSENIMHTAIPYGPFLVLGTLYYYFFREIPGIF